MLLYLRFALSGLWFGFAVTINCIYFLFRPFHVYNNFLVSRAAFPPILRIAGVKVIYENREELEKHHPCIFTCNHQSSFDIVTMGHLCPKRTFVIGKKSLLYIPFFGWAFFLGGNYYINRKDLEKAVGVLQKAEMGFKENRSVILFPEGTRSKGKGLSSFKKGAFYMSLNSGRPIVPIVIEDYAHLKFNSLRAGDLRIRVLPAVYPNEHNFANVEDYIAFMHGQYLATLDEFKKDRS